MSMNLVSDLDHRRIHGWALLLRPSLKIDRARRRHPTWSEELPWQGCPDVLRFIRMTAPAMKEDGARCLMGSAHSQFRWLRITLGV